LTLARTDQSCSSYGIRSAGAAGLDGIPGRVRLSAHRRFGWLSLCWATFDEFHFWMFLVVAGRGQRLLDGTTQHTAEQTSEVQHRTLSRG
jgi:hypothetical protein